MAEKRTLMAEVMDGVGLITINVPRSNAATTETWEALTDVLARYAQDREVRVVVVTGAGHHAFVTDPDAAEMEAQALHDRAEQAAFEAMAAFPKPSIARVRGDCLGAGLLLALHADLIIAAEDSAFALPAARWGAAYPPRSVAALVQLVGPQQARRLLFTGRRIEAAEAARIGLVAMVTEDTELSDTVVDLAQAMADAAPLAVAAAKRMVAEPGDPALNELMETCRRSEDYAAGVAALRTDHPPLFRGR